MLLANCVRRINKINITKCLNSSISRLDHRCVTVASSTKNPANLANNSLPNLTSTSLFTTASNQCIDQRWGSLRFYSNDAKDKDKKNDTDDDDLENWSRKLPKFDVNYVSTPTIYFMLKNVLSTLLIRSYFDQQFNKSEFIAGARQAVQVVSHYLAAGNFESLQDMVDDDTISKMRRIVGPMTPEQRQLIAVNDDDIQWIFPHEIQFITKENVDENKSRFFVEIMVVIHAFRGEVDWKEIVGSKNNGDVLERMEKYYTVANYRFIKEFTKGVEDDWTINHILHVKPTDEMKENEKMVKEL